MLLLLESPPQLPFQAAKAEATCPNMGLNSCRGNKLFWEYIIFTDFPNTLREKSSLSAAAAAACVREKQTADRVQVHLAKEKAGNSKINCNATSAVQCLVK